MADIAQLTYSWARGELQRDTDFLEKILIDDFMGIGPLGFRLSRQEWLANHGRRLSFISTASVFFSSVEAITSSVLFITPR